MLMGYSKNQDAAKKMLAWIHTKPVFEQWFTSQQGYTAGATTDYENDPVWTIDPVMAPFKNIPKSGRMVGYAGPPNQKAAEVRTKYIIVDMYAKAIQGMKAEDSVKLAADELVKVYGA
jgi:multiple sugar transport system substrate-binding protein